MVEPLRPPGVPSLGMRVAAGVADFPDQPKTKAHKCQAGTQPRRGDLVREIPHTVTAYFVEVVRYEDKTRLTRPVHDVWQTTGRRSPLRRSLDPLFNERMRMESERVSAARFGYSL